jgi:nicotinamide-nucleotide adenylyltransferase
MKEENLGRIGVIGRFKPLHRGGAVMLESLCERAEHVVIGIGSSNKYNVRNPYSAEESREMIDAVLSKRFSNYSFISVPDFAHIPEYSDGQKWKEYMVSKYGHLDHFISGNGYVKHLLEDNYDIIHPATLIPREKWVKVRGTMVRVEMARGGNWRALVPEEVADYLEKGHLVQRFLREFGLETLANFADEECCRTETLTEEYNHTMEI